ncbi:MAG TPA: response regulator [Cellvibrionaceae bacterium]|nr:response regulator [Cellvibrionaceae bacterium]HMW71944.1 response regulator [Cellvibrionaceae bacterium]HNG58549.1 response regulator [Cellvibrionaceae bacterium]
MAKRRVLIVDDSKTAQVRLRKMLERFDVDVDTVNSAEEALGYLSYRQPSVIFLDHHMEGMDGLAALKIIKANPGTALIPVIMYTSEQGDVYVGQARALGALDIISKEVIKQVDLEKLMGSLNIYLIGAEPPEAEQVPHASTLDIVADLEEMPIAPAAASLDELPPANDLARVQLQIGRLFEIHIAKVRQEIEDSTKFLMRRLSKEIQERSAKPYVRPVTPVANPSNEPLPPIEVESEKERGISTFILALVLLGVAFLGYHLYINNAHLQLIAEKYDVLQQQNAKQEALINRLFEQSVQGKAAPELDTNMMLETLSWASNMNNQVAFGEQALNDQRIYPVGELVGVLKAANFAGTVYLDIHLGNFCVVEDPSGRYILPEPESNIEDCVFLADKQPQVPLDSHISVGFLNYVHSAPVLTEGPIELEFAMQGYSQPKASYPPKTSGTSAGEWNEAARKNNRVSFSFARK